MKTSKRNIYFIIIFTFFLLTNNVKATHASVIGKRYTIDSLKNPMDEEGRLNSLKGKFDSWQAQLEFLLNGGDKRNYFKKNNLTLIRYSKTPQAFKEEPDDITVVSSKGNKLAILKLTDNAQETKRQRTKKSRMLEYFSKEDKELFMIDLNWEHEGKPLKTRCVVSKRFNCLVYDTIISNVFLF